MSAADAWTVAVLMLALLGVLFVAERLVLWAERRGWLVDPDPAEWDEEAA